VRKERGPVSRAKKENMTTKYAVLSVQEGPRYGTIMSLHHSAETAEAAKEKLCNAVLRRYPNAITHLMYEVWQLPTPAGATGKVGARIAIDLSRR